QPLISPLSGETTSTVAPASRSFCSGTSSSDCSKPWVARMAMRLPFRSCIDCLRSLGCPPNTERAEVFRCFVQEGNHASGVTGMVLCSLRSGDRGDRPHGGCKFLVGQFRIRPGIMVQVEVREGLGLEDGPRDALL